MDCTSTRLPYRQTSHFTKIILDYLDHAENLKPFYAHLPSLHGIQKAIDSRKNFSINRQLLVEEFKKQYSDITPVGAVQKNIELLLSEKTFTIVTAHQPNIFTGPLYFIYKILHAIKLAKHCKTSLPQYDFIPVFYMGSEDADLDELGHFYLNGEKLAWNTKQTGAVGRMIVDKEFLKLIAQAEGQLTVLPFGNEIISLIKDCYSEGMKIQDATFKLLNSLFGEYGLIVLIPDNAALKKQAAKIFEDDLLHETPSVIVEETANRIQAAGYKLQANPREINLFYLEEGMRERIVRIKDKYITHDSRLTFDEKGILNELVDHPERFSPNVILRGIYQETILPNLVYIGGGGEIAYWLQLKDLFDHYKVPYPVLLLRNSILLVEKKWQERISRLGFGIEDFFLPEQELMTRLVSRETKNEIQLNGNFTEAEKLYESLKKQAESVDASLGKHVEALKAQSIYRLQELEKKILRAEKRKFTDQQRQIQTIREKLFPKNSLQERIDNFMYYYAKWGKSFIDRICRHSLSLEEEFVVINEK
ncbi:MAG: bacillithiol biosynthesis cysteine-adding enzyme BshC [Chitinophagales bacterium]